SELSSDRAGLLACQDPTASLRVNLKFAGGGDMSQMDLNAFLEQAKEYEETGGALDRVFKILGVLGRSHPFNTVRAAELQRWIAQGHYERVLAGEYRRRAPDATVFAAPGNPGTAQLGPNLSIGAVEVGKVVEAVKELRIDLTVVGPEAPLAAGLADALRATGRPVFGPDRAAARIESSKAFAKEVMQRAGVPTPASRTFDSLAPAIAYIHRHAEPLVVKASGLAGGKGAVVCVTRDEA